MNEQPNIPQENPTYMPNKTLNFFISFVPGAGQMYQGLLQRGAILMAIFSGCIALTAFFGSLRLWGVQAILIGLSVTGIVITYFYSFFDSMRTCRLIRCGVWMSDKQGALDAALALPQFDLARKGRTAAGVILIVIGAFGAASFALNNFIPREILDAYLRPLLEAVVPLAFLIVGLVLLIKGRRRSVYAGQSGEAQEK